MLNVEYYREKRYAGIDLFYDAIENDKVVTLQIYDKEDGLWKKRTITTDRFLIADVRGVSPIAAECKFSGNDVIYEVFDLDAKEYTTVSLLRVATPDFDPAKCFID